jgi:V/A-type H+-transporting ATPase subunit I
MISLGLVLNIINRLQRGDVLGAFLDKFGFAGLLFYWGTLAILTNTRFFASRGLMGVSIVFLLGLPMLGWVVKEPAEHLLARRRRGRGEAKGGMGEAITESLVGAFEGVLSYLANTISFVRLAAYAMSHAALLVAAFMLATQVKEISVGGSLWSIVVIILGNAVAIVLEGIIASVQALRLEYYEFFGKFFSGNGQPFDPFRLPERGRA